MVCTDLCYRVFRTRKVGQHGCSISKSKGVVVVVGVGVVVVVGVAVAVVVAVAVGVVVVVVVAVGVAVAVSVGVYLMGVTYLTPLKEGNDGQVRGRSFV